MTANNQGFQLKGDVKIGGTPASLEYRKARGDDASRSPHARHARRRRARQSRLRSGQRDQRRAFRSGSPAASAPAPDRDGRFAVEADLTSAQIDGFLPGWVKPAGKPARATFTLTTKPQSIRVDDLADRGRRRRRQRHGRFRRLGRIADRRISRPTDFPTATAPTSRSIARADGALRVIMRGDVYDGRGFIKTTDRQPGRQNAASQTCRSTSIST